MNNKFYQISALMFLAGFIFFLNTSTSLIKNFNDQPSISMIDIGLIVDEDFFGETDFITPADVVLNPTTVNEVVSYGVVLNSKDDDEKAPVADCDDLAADYFISYVYSEGPNGSNPIDNTSGFDTDTGGVDVDTPGYGDYTSKTFVLDMSQGLIMNFDIKADGNHPDSEYHYIVWIDRDQNGQFENTSEYVESLWQGSSVGGDISGSFDLDDLPEYESGCEHPLRTYTLRIIMTVTDPDTDCELFGETEYYQIQFIMSTGECFDPPLPVKLISFTLEQSGADVVLNWETSGEVDNSHFDVEVSTDAINFEYLGTVVGNGTAEEVNQYSFVHEGPVSGTKYYRLKQVNLDGSFEYFVIRGISIEGNGPAFIYPNPAVNQVVLSNLSAGTSFVVLDVQGRKVMDKKTVQGNTYVLDTSELPQGTYLIRFSSADGQIESKRLYINK